MIENKPIWYNDFAKEMNCDRFRPFEIFNTTYYYGRLHQPAC